MLSIKKLLMFICGLIMLVVSILIFIFQLNVKSINATVIEIVSTNIDATNCCYKEEAIVTDKNGKTYNIKFAKRDPNHGIGMKDKDDIEATMPKVNDTYSLKINHKGELVDSSNTIGSILILLCGISGIFITCLSALSIIRPTEKLDKLFEFVEEID